MDLYFKTDDVTLDAPDQNTVADYYNQGFLFTRIAKGNLYQTRSLRVDLELFELSSENRRILNKNTALNARFETLPLENYSWEIHALGKDFYTKRFGDGTMTAAKIKEMFTDLDKSNMNSVFVYELEGKKEGYALSYSNDTLVHYAYPFYNLEIPKEQSIGLGMMLKAIIWAKENGKKFIYLGSIVKPESKYKLQFTGLEWFDTETKVWSKDLEEVKKLINQ